MVLHILDYQMSKTWDSTSLRDSHDLVESRIKHNDKHQVSEAASSTLAQSWLWGSQVALKKC